MSVERICTAICKPESDKNALSVEVVLFSLMTTVIEPLIINYVNSVPLVDRIFEREDFLRDRANEFLLTSKTFIDGYLRGVAGKKLIGAQFSHLLLSATIVDGRVSLYLRPVWDDNSIGPRRLVGIFDAQLILTGRKSRPVNRFRYLLDLERAEDRRNQLHQTLDIVVPADLDKE